MQHNTPISLKQLQAVAGGLLMGQVAFMLTASIVKLGGMMHPMPGLGMILLIVVGATMVGGSIAAMVMRAAITRAAQDDWQNRIDDDDGLERIFGRFWVLTITTAALVEGTGLLGSLTVLIAGEWLALLSPVLTIALAIGLFPNSDRWAEFHDAVTQA